jgi:hypothetical protein
MRLKELAERQAPHQTTRKRSRDVTLLIPAVRIGPRTTCNHAFRTQRCVRSDVGVSRQ